MAFGALKGTLTGNSADIGATNDITGSVSVAVGDLVFVVFGETTSLTVTGLTDNLGNTHAAQNAGTDFGETVRTFYSRVTSAGTLTTITAAATASAHNWCGFAAVIEGPFVVSPLDANPANDTLDETSPFTCPATGTLAQASEIVIAWVAANYTVAFVATSPNLLAGSATAPGALMRVAIGYQVVAATTSVAPEFTAASNPTQCCLGTASFKADAGGGGGSASGNLPLLGCG